MKEHPMLFSTEMVKAILAGRKVQTRRVLRPQPPRPGEYKHSPAPDKAIWQEDLGKWWLVPADIADSDPSPAHLYEYRCPYGVPGGRLWVREAWADVWTGAKGEGDQVVEYRADTDGTTEPGEWPKEFRDDPECGRWRPSIHMPRRAARIVLEVPASRHCRLVRAMSGAEMLCGVRHGEEKQGS